MVFLDFFEALLGCAEVYVIEASEQPDLTAILTTDGDLQPDITAVVSTKQIAVPSVSLVEQVLLIFLLISVCTYFLLCICSLCLHVEVPRIVYSPV